MVFCLPPFDTFLVEVSIGKNLLIYEKSVMRERTMIHSEVNKEVM
jgi:hypothetical protein